MLARRILMLASACAVLLATADVGSAAQKKMVLVYSRTLGFRHRDAIEKGNPILKRLAEELGYRCVVSEDPSVFDPENVRKWDLMIFNNTTGRMNFSEPRRLKAFMDRIKVDGAGFMGFHAAADCFYAWPEYGEMVNAYFAGHPWNQVVRVRIEDPDHPLMKPFGKGPFVIRDEIYQFRNYKRSNVRVLMSIDPRSVDISRGRRPDRDYAMCWIRTWGKGRVYYCAHGHYGHVFENKTFQEHVKLAMQWAIGDIEVDTTPSKEIDRAALAAKAVETLKAARRDEDRLAALDTLSWCPSTEALDLVVPLLDGNAKLAAAAADAAAAILAEAKDVAKARRIEILKKAFEATASRSVRKSVRAELAKLGVTDLPIKAPPGFVTTWWVAGPIKARNLFQAAFPPEQEGVDLKKGFKVGGRQFRWKRAFVDDDGILDLNAALGRQGNVAGYMYAVVTVEKPTEVELQVGSDDGFVLWLNGQRLGGKNVNRAIRPGSDRFKATLKAGANHILLKVIQGGGDWAGCLRIVGPKGQKVRFTLSKG